ncbi:hypothetical protein [uncultured Endozoicomonas sp.]|uniref:SPOR domain-containing protein n=1 Tax=uncultured Endozoicomonas sp. TaxID=432652 RepID=UPI002611D523|nr:hypothetical protein [uncultured Endozoicomonas sp.]
MPGRVFKEKQLRLCVVAALTSLSAPVAESLLLPPKPLASNISWRCDSGLAQQRLCNNLVDPNYRYARNTHNTNKSKSIQAPPNSSPASQQPELNKPVYSQNNLQPDFSEPYINIAPENRLLNLSGNQYVLQWMAAKERGQLEALKQRYPVLKDALIAKYERSGNTWFVLLDGPFKSRTDAMVELESPPRSAMARELYPWTRSLASIQKLNPVVSNPSYRVAKNNWQDPTQERVSYSTPLLVTTEQTAPYINQQYIDPPTYNDNYSSQQVEVVANRQSNSHYERGYENGREMVLPYGAEFDEVTNSGNNSSTQQQSYQNADNSQSKSQSNHTSVSAYINPKVDQQSSHEVDYNLQNTQPVSYNKPAQQPKLRREPSYHPQLQYAMNVLTANPRSYTIEWMSSNRKASLERAQLRYSELQNTQIVRYNRNNRKRYMLVSMLFVNRAAALDALLTPSLARISTRFSPKVRRVADLQTMVGNTVQDNHAWVGPALEPSIQKRHWIGTDDPGNREYIVHSRSERSRAKPVASNYSTLPQTVTQRMPEPKSMPIINNDQQQLSSLLNTPGDAYTIQWFSSSNEQSIEQLKQRFPQLQDAMTVRVQKGSRQWFVLVQGQYRNSQEAIRALKTPSMQTIATVLHPWTRPVDSLRKLSVATL